MLTPSPPLGSNSDIVEFQKLLTVEDPLGQTFLKGYLGILHWGKLGDGFFSFLG